MVQGARAYEEASPRRARKKSAGRGGTRGKVRAVGAPGQGDEREEGGVEVLRAAREVAFEGRRKVTLESDLGEGRGVVGEVFAVEDAGEEALDAGVALAGPRRVVGARADAHLLEVRGDGRVERGSVARLDEVVVCGADEEGGRVALRRVAQGVDVEDVEVRRVADGAADPAQGAPREERRDAVRAPPDDVEAQALERRKGRVEDEGLDVRLARRGHEQARDGAHAPAPEDDVADAAGLRALALEDRGDVVLLLEAQAHVLAVGDAGAAAEGAAAG